MTETRFNLVSILLGGLAGLIVGAIVGVVVGFVIVPARGTNVDISDLKADSQDNYIVLVSDAFAYDKDVAVAQQRLTQLNDKDIKAHITRLAKSYATSDSDKAARLAALVLAMGSNDSTIRTLAQKLTAPGSSTAGGAPTKFAQIPPTATNTPTDTPTPTVTPSPTNTRVPVVALKPTAALKPTEAPTVAVAALAAAIPPDWRPAFPSQWWRDIRYTPATATAGQTYWRLKSALFCDVNDTRNNCPDLTGGNNSHDIYLSLLDQAGNCTTGNIHHVINTGDEPPVEKKDEPFPWDQCNFDYQWNMYGEGNSFWVDGYPSDKIEGLCMCSVVQNLSNRMHVRYYLIFQLATR